MKKREEGREMRGGRGGARARRRRKERRKRRGGGGGTGRLLDVGGDVRVDRVALLVHLGRGRAGLARLVELLLAPTLLARIGAPFLGHFYNFSKRGNRCV